MTAIVLAFCNRASFEQASSEASRLGLPCHAFPLGIAREASASFYRRWLLKHLPHVTPAKSVMVVPLCEDTKDKAPDLLCDLALAVKEPETVAGYLIGADD